MYCVCVLKARAARGGEHQRCVRGAQVSVWLHGARLGQLCDGREEGIREACRPRVCAACEDVHGNTQVKDEC